MKPLTSAELAAVVLFLKDSGLDVQALLQVLAQAYPPQEPQLSKSVAEWLQDECDYSFES